MFPFVSDEIESVRKYSNFSKLTLRFQIPMALSLSKRIAQSLARYIMGYYIYLNSSIEA